MSKEDFSIDLGGSVTNYDKYDEIEQLAKQTACTSTVSQSITYPNGQTQTVGTFPGNYVNNGIHYYDPTSTYHQSIHRQWTNFDDREEIEKTTHGFNMEVYQKLQDALRFQKKKLNYKILNCEVEDVDLDGILDKIREIERAIEFVRDDPKTTEKSEN